MIKVNKLLLHVLKGSGQEGFNIPESLDKTTRCTGDTTGTVFSIIGYALSNPEVCIKAQEWLSEPSTDIRALMGYLERTIDKNDLKFFEISYANGTVTYRPFGYYLDTYTAILDNT